MEQLENGRGGEVEVPRRGVGVRRRRHHDSLGRQQGGASLSSCEDGFGEGGGSRGRNKSSNEDGRSWRRGGGQARGSGGGKEGAGGRRPALVFVAQAVLSFVGMVVLPTRIAYEVLLQPRVFESHRGDPPPPPLSLAVRSDTTGAAAAAGSASGTLATGGAGEGAGRRRLSDFSRGGGGGGGGGGSNGLVSSKTEAGWHGRRRVLQTDEGDSFTYTSRTQFDLCAAPGSELTEDALRAGIMEVLGVEQEQTEGTTGTVQEQVTEFCDDESQAWMIAIGNEPSETQSAAVISAEQMETVRSSSFTTSLAESVEGSDSTLSVDPAGLSYNSLGYIVLYDENQAVTTANSDSLDSDFVAFRGPDQWWPWWAWLLFGFVLLCCICPLAACIYYYRPGHAGPPSPSGAGGGPGMFGGSRGGSGKGIEKGGVGGGDAEWMTQYEKGGGGGGGYGDKDEAGFNDAATGISVDTYSPREEVATSGSAVDSATVVQAAESPKLESGEWPEAIESGGVMSGVNYTSREGASTVASQQGEEATAVQSAEADRAAGVDPSRREHDTHSSAISMNPLVTSASFNPEGRVPGSYTGDSAASLESSRKSSEASWAASRKSVSAGDSGLGILGTTEEADEEETPAPLISGPSGRTLGSAAAALGGEDSHDEEGRIGSGSAFGGGGGGGGRAQSAASYRTEDGSASVQSTSTLAALEAKAEAEAYEAELAASAPAPAPAAVSEVGTGSIDGPAAVVTATSTAVGGLPPSGRSSSESSSRILSMDHPAAAAAAGTRSAARSRAGSNSSSVDVQRDLTEEERQMRAEESEAARAASLLRGTSFKTPLQPDLERAISVERQERRQQAVEAVEASLAPGHAAGAEIDLGAPADLPAEAVAAAIAAAGEPAAAEEEGEAAVSPSPAATGFMGKVVAGMGMSRFFGPRSPANTPSAAATAADDGAEPTAEAEAATATADSKAAPAQDVAAAGAVVGVPAPEEAQAGDAGADAAAPVAGEGAGADADADPAEGAGPATAAGVLPPTGEDDDGSAAPAAIAAAAAVAAGAAAAGVAETGSAAGDADSDQKAGASSREEGRPEQVLPPPAEAGVAAAAAAAPAPAPAAALGPEEVKAYSENVDRTLEELPMDDGGGSMPMSELLARAELEASTEHPTPTPTVPPLSTGAAAAAAAAAAIPSMGPSAAVAPSAAPAAAPSTAARAGLPPAGPGQAAALALLQQSVAGSQSPSLDMARLLHNAEEGGMTLEEVEACLASPIVATPPALLRPGVGAARGGPGAPRSRGLLQRNSASGSYISSRSTSITEDMMSNNNLTEDEMSSDAQTTDVSRTSSFVATGSSFEENPAQSQAARNRFLAGGGASAGTGTSDSSSSGAATSSGAAAAAAVGANPPPGGGGHLSSLAERLARAEETVGREHEKGLLYRQGPEGVAAAVAGEELPLPPGAAASLPRGIRGGGGGGGSSSMSGGGSSTGEEKVESLADILARADDGPGNLKETFRLLDDMEARRLEELNAAASAEDADDDTKARWRGSLAELMVKVDRSGNLRDILDIGSDTSESASASDGKSASASDGNRGGGLSSETDSTSGSAAQTGQAAAPRARPE